MVARLALLQATAARLDAIPSSGPKITVYRGEVPTSPPLLAVDSTVDPARRVAPYVVLFGGAGNPIVQPDLAETADELDWSARLVVAAGYENDLLDAVDRIHAWLFRWTPAIDGTVCGRFTTPPGFDAAVRRFDQVQPIRFEMPLQYHLVATT